MQTSPDWRRIGAYAAVYILWGLTFLGVRTVVLVTPPFATAGFRFLLSGVLLLALCRAGRRAWPSAREWAESAKLGLLMFAVNSACFFWAEQRLYSPSAAVVVATMPVWVAVSEWVLAPGYRPSPATLAGSALGIGGVCALAHTGNGAASGPHQTHLAILVLLLGTVCWAAGSVWSRALALPADQGMRSALQMTTGGAALLLLAGLSGETRAFLHAVAHWTPLVSFSFAYLVLASIVAFTAYVWLLHHEPAGRVATYAYVNPLVALLAGVLLAHEAVGPWQLLGCGLVLAGVFAALSGRKPVPVAARVVEPPLTSRGPVG